MFCLENTSRNCCPWPKIIPWPYLMPCLQGQGDISHLAIILVLLSCLIEIFHTIVIWSKCLSWPWTKVISQMSRWQCIHRNNLCPCHHSLMLCLISIILISRTIVVRGSVSWPYQSPRLQGQAVSSLTTYSLPLSGTKLWPVHGGLLQLLKQT